jgi:hypothetical protein
MSFHILWERNEWVLKNRHEDEFLRNDMKIHFRLLLIKLLIKLDFINMSCLRLESALTRYYIHVYTNVYIHKIRYV